MLGLEETLHTIYETPVETIQKTKDNNQIIDDNLIHQQPSKSWTPLDSTKLLRSTGINNTFLRKLFYLNIIKILIILVSKIYFFI